jgi:hypothetical protein
MARKRKNEGLVLDVLSGAAAGALGTYLMSPAMQVASKVQPDVDKEWEAQASWDENATVKAAEKAFRPLGVELGEKKSLAGQLVHWGYGIAWGVGYALLTRSLRKRRLRHALLFGGALWLIGDEIAVPALKLAPRPEALPPSSHAKALWAHLVYGAATEGAFRMSQRVLR